MKKEIIFGSARINLVRKSTIKSLVVPDAFGESELTVSDGEIRDREDSAPVVIISISENEKEKTMLINKIDCLALATFLLNIHNEYAYEQNGIRFQEQQDMLNLNNKVSTSTETDSIKWAKT